MFTSHTPLQQCQLLNILLQTHFQFSGRTKITFNCPPWKSTIITTTTRYHSVSSLAAYNMTFQTVAKTALYSSGNQIFNYPSCQIPFFHIWSAHIKMLLYHKPFSGFFKSTPAICLVRETVQTRKAQMFMSIILYPRTFIYGVFLSVFVI